MSTTTNVGVEAKVELARMCLALIRDIAARGACAVDSWHVGYALEEISQVLLERTGTQERRFEPVPAGQIVGLEALHEELDIVDACSQDLAVSEQGGIDGTAP